ncbi:MAG: class I SAM-dependent methyltransferase, partial [Tumebacillaceae bacterium]
VEVPACAEYTPELQLQLLGIDAENIQEPILDLGCGEHGRLVHHLRERGYQAIGVDRTVIESSHLIKSDWLQMPVTNETWGTVISHMAFSNHFAHHHMRKDGEPEGYAKMYMSILRSLKKGGRFYYAPGLPFIEELLPPEQYRVTRIQNEEQKEFYSTRIEKL